MNVHYYELFLSAAHKNTNLYCQPSLTRKIVLFCGKEDLILFFAFRYFSYSKNIKRKLFQMYLFNAMFCIDNF